MKMNKRLFLAALRNQTASSFTCLLAALLGVSVFEARMDAGFAQIILIPAPPPISDLKLAAKKSLVGRLRKNGKSALSVRCKPRKFCLNQKGESTLRSACPKIKIALKKSRSENVAFRLKGAKALNSGEAVQIRD
jgi:hypothetical protein